MHISINLLNIIFCLSIFSQIADKVNTEAISAIFLDRRTYLCYFWKESQDRIRDKTKRIGK